MANELARSLRKRLTIAEQCLWDELKLLKHEGYHFRRQAPIGVFIVDFVCYTRHLIIEVDSVQHDQPLHAARDCRRDVELQHRGFTVMRLRNGDVMEKLDGVMREIWSLLEPLGVKTQESIARVALPPLAPPHVGGGARGGGRRARDRQSRIAAIGWMTSSYPLEFSQHAKKETPQ